MPYPYATDRDELQSRLRKIEGQVRGIQRMLDQDAYCIDVLTQISAVASALDKVGLRVLREHISGCLRDALTEPGNGGGKERIDELVKAVERFVAS